MAISRAFHLRECPLGGLLGQSFQEVIYLIQLYPRIIYFKAFINYLYVAETRLYFAAYTVFCAQLCSRD